MELFNKEIKFNKPVYPLLGITEFPYFEYTEYGQITYRQYLDGSWQRWEYNENGNEIYFINSHGYWEKRKYENGVRVYLEDSDGNINGGVEIY